MSGNSWLRRMLGASHVPGTNMTKREWDELTPMQRGLFNRSDGVGKSVAETLGQTGMGANQTGETQMTPEKRAAMASDLKFLQQNGSGGGNSFLDFLKSWFDSSKQ